MPFPSLRSPFPRSTTLMLPLLLSACDCKDDPTAGSLAQNVGESFSTCNDKEIKFLAGKHNLQLAFRPCGNNTFSAYRWSPDGTRLYFQLVLSAYVMDADAPNKATTTLPVASPTGEAAWLTAERLVVPVVPDENSTAPRMAMLDMPRRSEGQQQPPAVQLAFHPLEGLITPSNLQLGDSSSELLFTARTEKDGPLDVYRLDLDNGEFGRAFDWLKGDVDTFTYTPQQQTVTIGVNDTVRAWKRDGTEVGTWTPAVRGNLDPSGTWMALEFAGTPTSIYHQRAWDEVSEGRRKREQERAEAFEDKLPEWYPKQVQPPTLSFVEMASGERWTITSFLGDHFQWYTAVEGWGSFFLWGFEGKQFKRNVALSNLKIRLAAMAEGREMLGVERFTVPPPLEKTAPKE